MKNGETADKKRAEKDTAADLNVAADANASAGFRASASKFVRYADPAVAAIQDRNA